MGLVLVGPGALGTLFAVRLARAGYAITVLARPGGSLAEGRRRFVLDGEGAGEAEVRVVLGAAPDATAEGIVLATKTYDLAEAARTAAGFGPAVPVLLIQNGLDVEAPVREAMGAERALVRAVVSVPATRLGPGRARQAGVGEVVLPAREPAARPWAERFGAAGVPVRWVDDLEREVWRKLLVNAAINPVTADHRVENGRLALDPWRGQALALLEEARAVAASEGFEFPREEAERDLFGVVRATAANRSSMLQDVESGRPTEIEAIAGALVTRGERHGLRLPQTRRVLARFRRARKA